MLLSARTFLSGHPHICSVTQMGMLAGGRQHAIALRGIKARIENLLAMQEQVVTEACGGEEYGDYWQREMAR